MGCYIYYHLIYYHLLLYIFIIFLDHYLFKNFFFYLFIFFTIRILTKVFTSYSFQIEKNIYSYFFLFNIDELKHFKFGAILLTD